jgi:WD40 repeat protein/tRNA A-37 threonylcarbamoyl transferase component Bud32
LLVGILALQMDFIDRDALVLAMNAWVLQKSKPLGQILLEQGAIQPADRDLLEVVVKRHLELHQNDAARSLAALSSLGSVQHELHKLADPDVQAGLGQLSTAQPPDDDLYATRPPSATSSTSTTLRFQILRPHAKGGLGAVFVAHDQELHRDVALKEIQARHADRPESRARFLREAEITGGLEHPGIVPVYGLGQYADGRPFYAMRFIRGDSLREAIRRFHEADKARRDPGERDLALRQLLSRFISACNALAYAHSRGVLHRDLKPDNIMLGKYGETLVVDWGLAKPLGQPDELGSADEDLLRPTTAGSAVPTEAGSVMGTPAYMSPEQAGGKLDQLRPASDVYSLGATLYTLLTGAPPFPSGDIFEILAKVQQGRFPPPRQIKPSVSPTLEAICLKAMARKPDARYRTAQELAADVEHWLADEPVTAYRESVRARLWRWGRKHRALVTGAAVLLLAAVAALALSTALIGQEQARTRQQRDLALEREREARRYWYVGDLNLAQQAWEGADVARVLRLLERQRPEPGAEDLRSFDWFYFWHLGHSEKFTLRGHRQVIYAVAFAPDGRSLASASHDGTVKLWDVATAAEQAMLQGNNKPIYSLAYAPDGQTIAAGDEGGQVKLWNRATQREQCSFRAHPAGVMALAFAPDGKTFATAGADGTVKLWETATGAGRAVSPLWHGLQTMPQRGARVWSVAFAPDGRLLASGGDDRTVVLWETATGNERARLAGHTNGVTCVSFAPDGKTVASGSLDATVRLWEIADAKPGERTLKGHRGPVWSVRFAPNGKSLASASEDRTVKLWDTSTWQERGMRKGHTAAVRSVAFAPDGKTLATGSFDKTVKVWDLTRDPEGLSLHGHPEAVQSLAFAPDGKTLATGSRDKTIKLWNVTTGHLQASLEGHTGLIYAVAFAPVGTMLASGSEDRTAKLWDPATGKVLATLQDHNGSVASLAFSPDGKVLATGSRDSTVKLWDVPSGRLRATLHGHTLGVLSLVFAPDGRMLASGSNDQAVKLWDVATGKELAPLDGPTREPLAQHSVYSVAFTRDGQTLAAGGHDGTVWLWDTKTGRQRSSLLGHIGPVHSVVFAPDGKTLATAGEDKTLRLWDLSTAQERLILHGHAEALECAAFSPDGKILAAGCADGAVKLWEAARDEEAVPAKP